tara:strand:+ start:2196 stop:2681 length:486 start_codon:yes stop_codon:yes gene_type:complete
MDIPLINIQDVRDLLDLSDNITEQKYNQHIISAQNWQLRELIGDICVDGLEDRKCSNSFTDEDLALMKLVKPYLVYYSYSKYVSNSMLHSSQDGIVKYSGDNLLQITETEKKYAKQYNEQNAEAYAKRILTLLKDNATDYPCYDCGDCCDSTYKGKNIFLG